MPAPTVTLENTAVFLELVSREEDYWDFLEYAGITKRQAALVRAAAKVVEAAREYQRLYTAKCSLNKFHRAYETLAEALAPKEEP